MLSFLALDILRDLRFAVRVLARERWFTAASVLALTLGVGVTTTMVTVINGYNFRGLPGLDRDAIVHVGTRDFGGREQGVSYPDYRDWRAGSTSFAALGAFSPATMTIGEPSRSPESVSGAYLSVEAFGILGEATAIGRGLAAGDDRPGATPVVLLGHRLWVSRYAADPTVLGRVVVVNQTPATVVGVMRDGFEFPFRQGLWLPLALLPGLEARPRDDRTLSLIGRLAPGVSSEAARAELASIALRLGREHPATNDRIEPAITRFGIHQVGRFGDQAPPLAILATAVFVLLIACANVASLLLARSAGRSREIAIRGAIGATRWRLVRQLFVENLLLSAIGSGLGLWASTLGVRFIAGAFGRNVPYWMSFPIDAQVAAVVTAICVGAALLFGTLPAAIASRPAGLAVMTGRGLPGAPATRRWTQALLVGELALAIVLLAGAGLLVHSFLAMFRSDRVLDAAAILTAQIELPEKLATPEARAAFFQRIDDRLPQLPSIAATLASSRPFAGAASRELTLPDRPSPGGTPLRVSIVAIGQRYFETLGLAPLRGRLLEASPSGRHEVVVNQRFVEAFFPDRDPIGRQLRLTEPKADPAAAPWLTIVGVAPSVRQNIASGTRPVVYLPIDTHTSPGAAIMVRRSADATVITTLRRELASLDPDVTLYNVRPLPELLDDSRLQHRLMGTLLAAFAGIALLLAIVGVYAAAAYAVRQRRFEIGVRMALGAQAGQVVWLFARRGLLLLAMSLPLGLAGAVAVGAVLQGLLIQTSPANPVTLGSILATVAAVTLTACILPARRALKREPLSVLRAE